MLQDNGNGNGDVVEIVVDKTLQQSVTISGYDPYGNCAAAIATAQANIRATMTGGSASQSVNQAVDAARRNLIDSSNSLCRVINGSSLSRILNITGGNVVTLRNLIFTGGNKVANSGGGSDSGGCIWSNVSTIVIENAAFFNCSAPSAQGVRNTSIRSRGMPVAHW